MHLRRDWWLQPSKLNTKRKEESNVQHLDPHVRSLTSRLVEEEDMNDQLNQSGLQELLCTQQHDLSVSLRLIHSDQHIARGYPSINDMPQSTRIWQELIHLLNLYTNP